MTTEFEGFLPLCIFVCNALRVQLNSLSKFVSVEQVLKYIVCLPHDIINVWVIFFPCCICIGDIMKPLDTGVKTNYGKFRNSCGIHGSRFSGSSDGHHGA